MEKKHRNKGITVELIKAAVAYAKKNGAKIIEGYPVESESKQAAAFMFTGSASSFKNAGFIEVVRNSPTRPIFRYLVPSPKLGEGEGEGQ
jgi:GNAT superfamily N-acetyltransferase